MSPPASALPQQGHRGRCPSLYLSSVELPPGCDQKMGAVLRWERGHLVGFKVMRIIPKCRRQGSGSASPKGRARALAPSQSYRFVNNSHDQRSDGRRPQIFTGKSSCLCKVGRAKTPQGSGRNPGEAAGEIIRHLEPARAEFLGKQRSPAASWLDLKQLTEPQQHNVASSPLQDREKP